VSDYAPIEASGQLESTLPSDWYTDSDVYALEQEHIFMREWLCVGREEDIPEPGDHQVLDVQGESVLLVRNREGQLRAFYNVCRHRGARLCAAGEQETSDHRLPLGGGVVGGRTILCPYHAWSYDLDGQLLRAPHIDEEMGLKVEDVQLHPVGCETWGGFIFLHLSPAQAKDFSAEVTDCAERLQRYPLASLRTGPRIRYEVRANWKVLCENYNECYHCGPVHPELCDLVPAFRSSGGDGLDWERGIPHREGADTFTTSGTSDRPSFPDLNEDELTRHKGDLVYPNLFLSLAREHVAAFILRPKGPAHTTVDCLFLFEPGTMAAANFDPADAVDLWHTVNRQDWSICERVQQGMQSRVHERGIFSPMEDWNLDIRRYVTERIGAYVDQSL